MKAGLSLFFLSVSLAQAATNHVINVAGNKELSFHPSKLTAVSRGDTIEFVFQEEISDFIESSAAPQCQGFDITEFENVEQCFEKATKGPLVKSRNSFWTMFGVVNMKRQQRRSPMTKIYRPMDIRDSTELDEREIQEEGKEIELLEMMDKRGMDERGNRFESLDKRGGGSGSQRKRHRRNRLRNITKRDRFSHNAKRDRFSNAAKKREVVATFTVTVGNGERLWFYGSQIGRCGDATVLEVITLG